MHLGREQFNPLAERLRHGGQFGILAHHFHEERGLLVGHFLAFLAGFGEGLAVLGIGIGVGFVAVGLTGLREQDQRRGIGGLETEREIEQDEGIQVECDPARLATIQTATRKVWAIRNVGVPKKRAKASAFSPNQSLPKVGAR